MAVALILEHSFLRGILLGLAIAAPVGPTGILCIRRTLSEGWQAGLLTGLGAATVDGVYGCIAGFGLSTIANFLVAQQTILKILGGLFLIYLSLRTLQKSITPNFAPPSMSPARTKSPAQTLWLAYASSVGLTLTNPATILSFVAILTGVGIMEARLVQALSLIAGIFLGSMLWWLFLSGLTHSLQQRLPNHFLQGINCLSGLILLGFGTLAIGTSFRG